MRYTQWKSFQKHLKEAGALHLSSCYFLIAKEPLWREIALKNILKILEPYTIISEAKQPSLFGAGLPEVFIKRDGDKKEISTLLDIKGPYFFFLFSELSHTTSLYKKGESLGIILDLSSWKFWEKEEALEGYIGEIAAEAGRFMTPSTITLLRKKYGEHPEGLEQEIKKLVCYTLGKGEITEEDVEALSTSVPEQTLWQLGDALMAGNKGEVLRMITHLLDKGHAPIMLLRQLRGQIQVDVEILLLEETKKEGDISKLFPYLKGSILDKRRTRARKTGKERLLSWLLAIDESEFLAKDNFCCLEWLLERILWK